MPLYNPSSSGASLTVEEEDGTPSVAGVTKIQVPNGSLINDSGTIVSMGYATSASGFTAAGARAYNSAAINLNNGSDTFLTFDSERYDTDAYHSLVTNTGRLTVPTGKDGKHLIVFNVAITPDPGATYAFIKLNGTTIIAIHRVVRDAGANCYVSVSTVYSLVATDYVEAGIQCNAGAIQALQAGSFTPEFSIAYLGA